MENSTDNVNQAKPGQDPFESTEHECEICHDTFYSYAEEVCEKCAYRKHLIKIGYSESYADDLVKTHLRFENDMRILLQTAFDDIDIAALITSQANSIIAKCHCNALEVGWNDGYEFAMKQPREYSSKIEIPKPITFKAVETRNESRIVICDRCEGTGKVRVYNEDPGYSGPGEEQCPICNGTGRRNLLISFMFSPIKDIRI